MSLGEEPRLEHGTTLGGGPFLEQCTSLGGEPWRERSTSLCEYLLPGSSSADDSPSQHRNQHLEA